MDRHDVSENVTAENVANLHQQDLKVEQQFNCRGLTYWFDDIRKIAFCLIEAPDEQSITDMHRHAHGEVPHVVIEVDASVVESFLGRIADPGLEKKGDLNVINDPALRTLMAVTFDISRLYPAERMESPVLVETSMAAVGSVCSRHNGTQVKHLRNHYLIVFNDISDALQGALELQEHLKKISGSHDPVPANLNIGICAGIPVTENKTFFEDTIKLAERLSTVANNKILVSSGVKTFYMNRNFHPFIGNKYDMLFLTDPEENMINKLLDFIESEWDNPDLKVDDFTEPLGLSKSQVYRKMLLLSGMPPNLFLREYRLNLALGLIRNNTMTLSEVAYSAGFGSLSYFSKCFLRRYGVLPSDYRRTTV
jgi:AraC-like DNA-binding protein